MSLSFDSEPFQAHSELTGSAAELRSCKQNMIRYYMHHGPAAFRFELAGDLDAADAATLEQDWHIASSIPPNRTLIIDLSFVKGIDESVRSLFSRWYARGAQFAAGSKGSRDLVESITERPFAREQLYPQTYQPWFSRTTARGKK